MVVVCGVNSFDYIVLTYSGSEWFYEDRTQNRIDFYLYQFGAVEHTNTCLAWASTSHWAVASYSYKSSIAKLCRSATTFGFQNVPL